MTFQRPSRSSIGPLTLSIKKRVEMFSPKQYDQNRKNVSNFLFLAIISTSTGTLVSGKNFRVSSKKMLVGRGLWVGVNFGCLWNESFAGKTSISRNRDSAKLVQPDPGFDSSHERYCLRLSVGNSVSIS